MEQAEGPEQYKHEAGGMNHSEGEKVNLLRERRFFTIYKATKNQGWI
jgi:hypothetical protein